MSPGTAGPGGPVVAPEAPGRLGSALEPTAALGYLESLGRWCEGRRVELDALDAAALQAEDGSELTGDIALSMALWKAVSDRYEQLQKVWDSGRVGQTERERLAALIWGRLDTTLDAGLLARSSAPTSAGLTVSLPEATRLSDALATQLRVRLGLELSGAETTQRIRDLRAQLERIRDQVALEPAGARQQAAAARQSDLARRLRDLTSKSERGGDVGGLLGPLEIEATTYERDLIVGGAQRREARQILERARRQRADLSSREDRLRALVADAVAMVDPAPKLAVPDVDALGPLPNTLEAIEAYVVRLTRVDRAMTMAEQAYGQALGQRRELVDRLEGYRAKAEALGVADQGDLSRAYAMASETLDRRPVPLRIAEQLVQLYQAYVQDAPERLRT